jgi:hypothetical protein
MFELFDQLVSTGKLDQKWPLTLATKDQYVNIFYMIQSFSLRKLFKPNFLTKN